MIIQNLVIGKDAEGNDLKCGDICNYEIYGIRRTGMIVYSETIFTFMFQQMSETFPAIPMNCVNMETIEKVISFTGSRLNKRMPLRKQWKAIYNGNLYSLK